MASKKMQITFSEENEDLYLYLKKYRYPSEIICKALRTYLALDLNNNSTDTLHDTIKKHVLNEDILSSIVKSLQDNNVVLQVSGEQPVLEESTEDDSAFDALLAQSAGQFEID